MNSINSLRKLKIAMTSDIKEASEVSSLIRCSLIFCVTGDWAIQCPL